MKLLGVKCGIVCVGVALAASGCGSDEAAPADVADTASAPDGDTAAPDAEPADTTDSVDTVEVDTGEADLADAEPGDVADAGDTATPWTPPTYTFGACGTTPATLAGCVDGARLEAAVRTLAVPRALGSVGWKAAQDHCFDTLTDLGFEVALEPTLTGYNVVGTKLGGDKAGEWVVLGAHYDGVPGCDAADDNASGVAGLLEVARVLSGLESRRSLAVTCWDDEERGLVGSQAQAAGYRLEDRDIALAVSFEMIGYTDDTPGSQTLPLGFTAIFPEAGAELEALGSRGVFITLIGGDDAKGPMGALDAAADAIGLPAIDVELTVEMRSSPLFADLRRSDHAAFWAQGYPAIQLTDTANFRNPNYHCEGGADTPETLDWDFMRATTAMVAVAIGELLVAEDAGTSGAPLVTACDIVAQDCEGEQRCVITTIGGRDVRACVPPAESPVGLGEVCTRPTNVLGIDTCAEGLTCTFYGGRVTSAPGEPVTYERVCSPWCAASADCEGVCISVGNGLGPDASGACRPTCDPFADTCGEGQRCAQRQVVEGALVALVCQPVGALAVNEPCTNTLDCARGGCFADGQGGGRCRDYCDDAHPCASGTCTPDWRVIGREGTLGYCEP